MPAPQRMMTAGMAAHCKKHPVDVCASGVFVCISPSESAAPSLLRDPCGPGRGSLLWLQVYLKLLLVYLMNGCLGEEAGSQCGE